MLGRVTWLSYQEVGDGGLAVIGLLSIECFKMGVARVGIPILQKIEAEKFE